MLKGHRRRRAELILVVDPYLSSSLRKELEKRGFSYADSHGRFHLQGDDLLIHIDGEGRQHQAEGQRGIGIDGVRAVQVILGEQKRAWSVKDLAGMAEVSAGQAHKVLSLLENEGLMTAEGRGPKKRRRAGRPGELLDWLAKQPSSKRREKTLEVALYARTPGELWKNASALLGRARIPHAFTGFAAAGLYEVGPSTIQRSVLRIGPAAALEEAAEVLGAEVTSRGTNLVLMKDTGRVGTLAAAAQGGVELAPAVRIFLDCFVEKRGEEVAQAFREGVLGF
ncbi:MAG: hypothetical protein ACKVPX_09085 [Myxococcaceae bacterium]